MAGPDDDPYVIPARVRCECGRTIHISVYVTQAQLEMAADRAVRKALLGGIRQAPSGATSAGAADVDT